MPPVGPPYFCAFAFGEKPIKSDSLSASKMAFRAMMPVVVLSNEGVVFAAGGCA